MSSETPRGTGYLSGILAAGARPFRYRSRVWSLLGVPDRSGAKMLFPDALPFAGFSYLRPLSAGEFEFPNDFVADTVRPSREFEHRTEIPVRGAVPRMAGRPKQAAGDHAPAQPPVQPSRPVSGAAAETDGPSRLAERPAGSPIITSDVVVPGVARPAASTVSASIESREPTAAEDPRRVHDRMQPPAVARLPVSSAEIMQPSASPSIQAAGEVPPRAAEHPLVERPAQGELIGRQAEGRPRVSDIVVPSLARSSSSTQPAPEEPQVRKTEATPVVDAAAPDVRLPGRGDAAAEQQPVRKTAAHGERKFRVEPRMPQAERDWERATRPAVERFSVPAADEMPFARATPRRTEPRPQHSTEPAETVTPPPPSRVVVVHQAATAAPTTLAFWERRHLMHARTRILR